jgi:aarF domain-containing kinase
MLKVCKSNGGMYIKAGQHIATLNNVLPVEYTSTLSAVQDKAQSTNYSKANKLFIEELGKSPEEM